ncbi:unnamed protein product, partial [marine sediment metagenome]
IAINPQLREDIANWFKGQGNYGDGGDSNGNNGSGGTEDFGVLSPIEVREHPNNYLDKEITIEGYYGGPGPFEVYVGKYVGVIAEKYPSEDTTGIVGVVTSGVDIELIEGGKYRFKGRLTQTKFAVPEYLHQLTPVTLIAFEAEPA